MINITIGNNLFVAPSLLTPALYAKHKKAHGLTLVENLITTHFAYPYHAKKSK